MKQLLLFSLILLSCAGSRDGSNNSDVSLRGDWQLVAMPNRPEPFVKIIGQNIPTLNFLTGSRLRGFTGCNDIKGSFTSNNGQMMFSKLVTNKTKVCTGYNEDIFLDALTYVNRYQIEDSRMHLLKDTVVLMVFAKKTS